MTEPLEALVRRWRELESQAVLAGTQNAYETCANELTAALAVRPQEARVMELAKRDAAEAHYGYGRWERDEWLLVSIPHKQPFDFCTQGRCAAIREAEARVEPADDVVCEHGTAMDVHCCNCHSGFIFDPNHECSASAAEARARQPVAAPITLEPCWTLTAHTADGGKGVVCLTREQFDRCMATLAAAQPIASKGATPQEPDK